MNGPRLRRGAAWPGLLWLVVILLAALAPGRAGVLADPTSGVVPTLAISPSAGGPQTPITVTGQGYPPGATVTFTYSETPGAPVTVLAATVAGTDGSLPPLQMTIPATAAPGGVGLISALWTTALSDAVPATGAATALFVVTPADRGLTAAPSAVNAGGMTLVEGTGFQPNAPIQVQVLGAGGAVVTSVISATSTSTGALLPLSLTIPLTATAGPAVINAVDTAGNVAGTPVVLLPPTAAGPTPWLVLSPNRAVAGQTVHFLAGGLPPRSAISLSLADAGGVQAVQTGGTPLTADATGQVGGTFIVPATQAVSGDTGSAGFTPANGFSLGGNSGTLLSVTLHAIPVESGAETRATAPLVIAGTRLEIFPAEGMPGQPFTLIGTGFGANEQVTVTETDDSGVISQLGIAQTSDSGVFSLSGQNPTLPVAAGLTTSTGAFAITATGEPSGLVASARLVVRPAPSLALTPAVAAPGQIVTVSGAGFLANSTVALRTGAAPSSAILNVATDGSGAFVVPFTVSVTARLGPVAIQAATPDGASVATVLTVNDRPASIRVSPLEAAPGQSLTVQGQGFASGEVLDLFLSRGVNPSYMAAAHGAFTEQSPLETGQPAALPGSLRTVTADAQGSFAASYPVAAGTPAQAAAFLLAVRGETSGRLALTAFGIAGATPSAPDSSSPPACQGQGTTATQTGTGGTVQYFQTPLRPSATAPGLTVRVKSQAILMNLGDQPASITIASVLEGAQGGSGSALTHGQASGGISVSTVTFDLAGHSVIARQIQPENGGQVVGVIVRAQSMLVPVDANGCPLSPLGGVPAAGAPRVRAVLLTSRTVTPARGHGSVQTDTTVTNAVGQDDASGPAGSEMGPATHWYFPAGGVGGAYAEEFSLFNPQDAPARVQVRTLIATGQAGTPQTLSLAPFGQGRLTPRRPACGKGKSNCAVGLGVVIESTVPIVVARGLAWGVPPGAHATGGTRLDGAGFDLSPGTSQAMRQQFIPYVSTADGDQAELAILNPTSCPTRPKSPVRPTSGRKPKSKGSTAPTCGARVVISAYTAYGARVTVARLTVPGEARVALPLARIRGGIGVGSGIYALSVQASTPVVAELAQYVGTGAGFAEIGVQGATQLSGESLAAGGLSARLFNPTSGSMIMRVQGLGAGGPYFAQAYQVAANASLAVTLPAPPGGGTVAGVSITCSGPCAGMLLMPGTANGAGKPATRAGQWGAILQ